MKKFYIMLLAGILLLPSCARRPQQVPPDQIPMYGNLPRTSEIIKPDLEYNEQRIQEVGSKEAAVERLIQEAETYQKGGYWELAIKQLNRAWLVDPDNSEVYYGFAGFLVQRRDGEGAERMYLRVIQMDPTNAMAMCLLAQMYQNKAVALSTQRGADKHEVQRYFRESYRLYERAGRTATQDEDLSYIYYKWAVWNSVVGNFKEAWAKIHISREHGGQFIDPKFIEFLSADMSDPGSKKKRPDQYHENFDAQLSFCFLSNACCFVLQHCL